METLSAERIWAISTAGWASMSVWMICGVRVSAGRIAVTPARKMHGSDVLDAGLLIPKRLHQNIFGRTKT